MKYLFYNLLMIPIWLPSSNLTIALISLPSGTSSLIWLIASNTLV